eukprot:6759167-Lingulodinium_polyedra.AAC.1
MQTKRKKRVQEKKQDAASQVTVASTDVSERAGPGRIFDGPQDASAQAGGSGLGGQTDTCIRPVPSFASAAADSGEF